jgi:pyruvate,water dikinase
MNVSVPRVRWFEDLRLVDVPSVGGKNASLGELTGRLRGAGVRVPEGFATTAAAFWEFLDAAGLRGEIRRRLDDFHRGAKSLQQTGAALRASFRAAPLPEPLQNALRSAHAELARRAGVRRLSVAVRSSATAEDLPEASFAGQHESYLNIVGEEALLRAVRNCFASLFTDRAISYREQKGFDHLKIALSVGVQRMVRSDKACAGVMFTLDPETGFPRVVVIDAVWGLGENIVQGISTPDEYVVFKPLLDNPAARPILARSLGRKEKRMVFAPGAVPTRNRLTTARERAAWTLSDDEVLRLARWGAAIEKHYGKPMDIEWAKDGDTGDLFIVQARPETVQSQKTGSVKTYTLKGKGPRLVEGIAIGDAIAAGPSQVIRDPKDMGRFKAGSVLVTAATNPDWVPLMKKAAAIVTEHGGRTSHAAIVSRELGVPAVVGAARAIAALREGREVTVSCAEGERGFVYHGRLDFEAREVPLEALGELPVRILMNVASPEAAFRGWRLPARGIGLARMEFIISDQIKIHPMALAHFERVRGPDRARILKLTAGHKDIRAYFVDRLAAGIAQIAASRWPDPVIVRLSDFKTNEYSRLLGGRGFEPKEENPMIGFRGASRYYDPRYKDGFALECRALKKVREGIGLENVVVMVPFCRTLKEADAVLATMAEFGLKRGERGLQVYVMCEIPSNVILAEDFADRFDGFSIGSNDLTQLTLGVDRDSGLLAKVFDERDEAVKTMIRMVIAAAHRKGRPVGICGQAPSDYPDFTQFLVEAGIDSLSLNPDSVVPMTKRLLDASTPKRV